jgi:hypothetical protein
MYVWIQNVGVFPMLITLATGVVSGTHASPQDAGHSAPLNTVLSDSPSIMSTTCSGLKSLDTLFAAILLSPASVHSCDTCTWNDNLVGRYRSVKVSSLPSVDIVPNEGSGDCVGGVVGCS